MLIHVMFLHVSSGKVQLSREPPWSRLTEHWMWRGERVHAADDATEAGQVKLVESILVLTGEEEAGGAVGGREANNASRSPDPCG